MIQCERCVDEYIQGFVDGLLTVIEDTWHNDIESKFRYFLEAEEFTEEFVEFWVNEELIEVENDS